MLKRTIRFLALGTASLSGSLLACGAPASGNATATTSAAVSLDVYNAKNVKVGSCLGTLIASDTVITAGHCVAGFSRWEVTAASGQVAASTLGYTYDWYDFASDMSHPDHDDIGLLKLGSQIGLAHYPTLATTGLASGTAVMRALPASSSVEAVVGTVAYDGTAAGFPHYYYTSVNATESHETGGALFDPGSNTIYGVVSGRGTVTGNLYIARAELLTTWLTPMTTCSSVAPAVATSSSFPITVECGDHGVTTGCGGGSGSGSGGSGSGSGGGSGSGSSSGTSSGSSSGMMTTGGSPPPAVTPPSSGTDCGGNGGMCQGSSCNGTGGGGDTPSGDTNGSNTSGGSAGGSGDNSGSSGGTSNSGAGNGGNSTGSTSNSGTGNGGNSTGSTSNSGSGNGGSTGSTSNSGSGNGGSTGSTSNGGSGNGGSTGSTGNSGSSTGSSNSSGSGNSASGNGSSGSTNGDGPGCTGSTCGGCSGTPGCTDGTEDFGGVPGTSSGTSSPPIQ